MRNRSSQSSHFAAELTILSTLHGEIRQSLPDVLSVGRAITSDIVLGDLGVGATHLQLRCGPDICLTAVDEPVGLEGFPRLGKGESRSFNNSFACFLGSVRLEVAVDASIARRRVGIGRWAALSVVGLFCVGSAAVAMSSRPSPQPSQLPSPPAPLGAKSAPAQHPSAELLKAELARRNLSAITLESLPEGAHRATGTITSTDQPNWQDMKQWADQAFAGRVLLIDRVTVGANHPVLAIQSAWIGDVPYIIDGAGEKLFAGAVISDGWIIDSIEANRVFLRRQGQRMAVKF
jgi:type III secretion protein D